MFPVMLQEQDVEAEATTKDLAFEQMTSPDLIPSGLNSGGLFLVHILAHIPTLFDF